MINPAPDTQSDSNLLNPQALERRHLTVLFSDLVGSTALSGAGPGGSVRGNRLVPQHLP